MATIQEFLRLLEDRDTDSTSLRTWLETNDFDIDANINLERTALHWCAYEGNERVVRLLLEAGAKVEGLTPEGLERSEPTALSGAIVAHHPSTALLLLNNGANPNSTNQPEYGYSSFHQLAEAVHMPQIGEVIERMLAVGADINLQNAFGNTPFQLACEEGNIAAIQAIMNFYPGININDHGGISVLEPFQLSYPELYAQLAGPVSVNATAQAMAGVDGLSIEPPPGDMDTSS